MGHTFTNHLYHIVFSTQQRRAIISPGIKDRLFAYMGGTVRKTQGSLLRANGTRDHVHLLVTIPPSAAVAKFIGVVKANSSGWASKNLSLPFQWQAGYASFTVSESKWRTIAEYIDQQEEHHRKLSFAQEFARLLEKHGIEFDREHYLD